jgi:uncharacterized protein YkwD
MLNQSTSNYTMIRNSCAPFLFVLVLFVRPAVCQSPSDTIRPQTINIQLIEQLVLKGIDSIRVAKGLKALLPDTSLAKAASDHAEWLVKQRSISHRQPAPEKANVQRRAAFYGGGVFLCGENIVASFILELMADSRGRRYYNNTYNDITNELIQLWVDSQGHYTNIINPIYTHTGLAVSYHPKTNRVVAVQVFGYLPPQQ